MDAPRGYPPPTLVRKKSGLARLRVVILLLVVAVVLAMCAVSRFIGREPAPRVASEPVPDAAPEAAAGGPRGVGDADSDAAALPDTAVTPPVAVEAPADTAPPAQPSPDAREPNRWYFVDVLGDGPGAIYSATGGQWNFAFACNARARTIEFIAVGAGAPDFDRQSISVGKVKLMLDATYSKDGGGTISTVLPAAHPFFNALDGAAPMEIQILAARKTIVPVGPDLVRLVKRCRGRA